MATIEELYKQVLSDDAEKATFAEAAQTAEGLQAFLAEHGCEASLEEVGEFLKAKQAQQGELADEELDSVAGGCNEKTEKALTSVAGFGLYCLVYIRN